jgi:predicted outer membrane repeat protein
MTRTHATHALKFPAVGFPRAGFPFDKQAEDWCAAQNACFANWRGFAERWSKHRMQDIESTIALAVRPWSSLDPRELAGMQQKWVAGIVDRYALDVIAFSENLAKVSKGGAVAGSPVNGHAPAHAAKHGDKRR